MNALRTCHSYTSSPTYLPDAHVAWATLKHRLRYAVSSEANFASLLVPGKSRSSHTPFKPCYWPVLPTFLLTFLTCLCLPCLGKPGTYETRCPGYKDCLAGALPPATFTSSSASISTHTRNCRHILPASKLFPHHTARHHAYLHCTYQACL